MSRWVVSIECWPVPQPAIRTSTPSGLPRSGRCANGSWRCIYTSKVVGLSMQAVRTQRG